MTPLEEIASLQDVSLNVDVELDCIPMTVRNLLKLDVESNLKLNRAAGENLDLRIGGAVIGYGEIVVSEISVGVRITDFRTKE
jgi:flagellar motor switch protein FliN